MLQRFALCQFVMEVDELLFEAFAPKRLKTVLKHGKTLEMKPLSRSFGLDPNPVVKLLLTSLMIGLMASFSILPQTEYLKAAGDAMCGARARACCASDRCFMALRPDAQVVLSTGRLALTRCFGPHKPSRAVRCGIPLSSVCREILACVCGQFGSPHFVNLSDAVNTWSTAYNKDPPVWSAKNWSRPNEEMAKLSLQGHFVDAVLTDPFSPPRACDRSLCTSLIRELDAANTSDTFPWRCCLLTFSAVSDNKASMEADVRASVSDLVATWAGRVTKCFDLLGSGATFVHALSEGVAMATIAAALDEVVSNCTQGCPFLRPLCKGGKCVRPTCNDLTTGNRSLCSRPSNAGAMARLMCSKTCGCSDPLSALLTTGPESGCLPECKADRETIYGTYACTDAQPDTTELSALARFATSTVAADHFGLDDGPNAYRLWTTLGCFALNVYDRSSLCDHDGTLAKSGIRSFMPFCPVTCGCTVDRLRAALKSCPASCSAIEAPTWNFKTDIPIGHYIEQNGYDPAVSDLTARLLHSFDWQHCPADGCGDASTPWYSSWSGNCHATRARPDYVFCASVLYNESSPESEVAAFYRSKYGAAIWNYTLNTRLGLGLGTKCRDFSNVELAAANDIIAANPRWGKSRYPESCSTADAATCSALLSGTLVFGGMQSSDPVQHLGPEKNLQFLVVTHPCPVKCNACPPDTGAHESPKCYAKLRVSVDGVNGYPLGTYTLQDEISLEGARAVYKRDGPHSDSAFLFYSPDLQSWRIVDNFPVTNKTYYRSQDRSQYRSQAGATGDVLCPDQEGPDSWERQEQVDLEAQRAQESEIRFGGTSPSQRVDMDGSGPWVTVRLTILQAGAPLPLGPPRETTQVPVGVYACLSGRAGGWVGWCMCVCARARRLAYFGARKHVVPCDCACACSFVRACACVYICGSHSLLYSPSPSIAWLARGLRNSVRLGARLYRGRRL